MNFSLFPFFKLFTLSPWGGWEGLPASRCPYVPFFFFMFICDNLLTLFLLLKKNATFAMLNQKYVEPIKKWL